MVDAWSVTKNGVNVENIIIAQRIVRHKGSTVGVRTGKVFMFQSVSDMIETAKRRRQVLAFMDDAGNEGTIRSGRKMRRCDSHVRNVTVSGLSR